MSVTGKLIISLVIAAAAAALLGLIHGGNTPFLIVFGAFSAATVATSLLTSIKFSPATTAASAKPAKRPAAKKAAKKAPKSAPAKAPTKTPSKNFDSADREEGEVKWFNVTKGFGFITRDNGEEIFVHFRSIRGEGRRSLRDGQRVSYVVSDSDKGPQAEDVEGLE
ncbi:MAG: cold-shock protein [Proteobacteria bacterium]|nr:cold-shock protein [Pseudomonadota bacterium]